MFRGLSLPSGLRASSAWPVCWAIRERGGHALGNAMTDPSYPKFIRLLGFLRNHSFGAPSHERAGAAVSGRMGCTPAWCCQFHDVAPTAMSDAVIAAIAALTLGRRGSISAAPTRSAAIFSAASSEAGASRSP